MATILVPTGAQLGLDSRASRQIPNWHNPEAPLLRDQAIAEKLKVQFPRADHRPTSVTYGYNCHGLTFGSRRTQITASAALRKMLVEDGYTRIEKHEALPGDVVIYVGETGDLEHSGMVLTKPRPELLYNMKVLSKWGNAHEVVHDLGECPYDSTKLEFYRIQK